MCKRTIIAFGQKRAVRIAIAGTPGSGKTSVARMLRIRGYKVIDLKRFAVKNGCVTGVDEKRGTLEVDVDLLNKKIKEKIKGDAFLEGHLSHLMDVDYIVVLRCRPSVLAERLRRKGWKKKKILENVHAEALGVITWEAMGRIDSSHIFELDTSPFLSLWKRKKVACVQRKRKGKTPFRQRFTMAIRGLPCADGKQSLPYGFCGAEKGLEDILKAIIDISSGRGDMKYRAGWVSWSEDLMEHPELW